MTMSAGQQAEESVTNTLAFDDGSLSAHELTEYNEAEIAEFLAETNALCDRGTAEPFAINVAESTDTYGILGLGAQPSLAKGTYNEGAFLCTSGETASNHSMSHSQTQVCLHLEKLTGVLPRTEEEIHAELFRQQHRKAMSAEWPTLLRMDLHTVAEAIAALSRRGGEAQPQTILPGIRLRPGSLALPASEYTGSVYVDGIHVTYPPASACAAGGPSVDGATEQQQDTEVFPFPKSDTTPSIHLSQDTLDRVEALIQ